MKHQDADIIPEFRRQMERNLQAPHRWFVYGLLAVTAYYLWGAWYGDASIYLCGRWLMFNPGELSGVYTSPLWALVASVAYQPEMFRFVAALVTLWAGYSVMEAVAKQGAMAEVLAVIGTFYFLWHGVMGYETSLVVGLMAALFRGNTWAAYLLPLVRPEAVIVTVLWGEKHRWKALLPFAVYALLVILADNGWSWVRAGNHFEWRYMAVPVTFLTLEASKRYGFTGVLVACMLAGFSLHDSYYKSIREASKGYSFDTITLKPIADALNANLEHGSVISSREIQIRRHLRPDLRVTSPEGLVTVDKPWTYRIASNRDGRDSTLRAVLQWQVNINGFVEWFLVERR